MVSAVLTAAIAELANVGYAALRVDDVAARAEVAKTTVYRRWPTKASLISAALRHSANLHEPLPDTGSVRADLLTLLERTMRVVSTPEGRAVARLLNTELADPEVEAILRSMKNVSRERRSEVVTRAIARGELPDTIDPLLIVDVIWGSVMGRLMRFGERTDRDTCTRLIDLVVTGAEHGGGRSSKKTRRASKET